MRFRFAGSDATFGIDGNFAELLNEFRPMCRGALAGHLRRFCVAIAVVRQRKNAAR